MLTSITFHTKAVKELTVADVVIDKEKNWLAAKSPTCRLFPRKKKNYIKDDLKYNLRILRLPGTYLLLFTIGNVSHSSLFLVSSLRSIGQQMYLIDTEIYYSS